MSRISDKREKIEKGEDTEDGVDQEGYKRKYTITG